MMNNATLQLAADASKMLLLLGRGILQQPEASRIRARIDDAVYILVRLGKSGPVTEVRTFENFIQNMHAALLREMALLDVSVLVKGTVGYNFKNALANSLVDVTRVKTIYDRVGEVLVPKSRTLNTGSDAALRGEILHKFSSIVRNDEWLTLLLVLGAQNPVALNTVLMNEFSSHQGRDERAAKVAALAFDAASDSKQVVPGVLTISAALTAKTAVQHAKVGPLFSALMLDSANATEVNRLLGEATRMEEVAVDDVPVFIQKRVDALVKGLTEQKKVHDAATKAKRDALARKKEDDAVSALKGMGAHLAVLAANPELLARALEAAGIAPQEVGAKVARALRAPINASKAKAATRGVVATSRPRKA